MTSIAALDANVLVPNALCDLLLRLADESVFQPRWSNQILDEVRRNVPIEPAAIERRIMFMNKAFEEAMTTGYEHLIDRMSNHPKDRHVLAVAVAADADRIVTSNLRDFPSHACEPHGVEAEHPEEFLDRVFAREPRLVVRVILEQARSTGPSWTATWPARRTGSPCSSWGSTVRGNGAPAPTEAGRARESADSVMGNRANVYGGLLGCVDPVTGEAKGLVYPQEPRPHFRPHPRAGRRRVQSRPSSVPMLVQSPAWRTPTRVRCGWSGAGRSPQ